MINTQVSLLVYLHAQADVNCALHISISVISASLTPVCCFVLQPSVEYVNVVIW